MTEKLMSVEELAALTSESKAVWRKRIFERQIPYVKCGRNVRVLRDDLDAWLADRLVPAEAPHAIR